MSNSENKSAMDVIYNKIAKLKESKAEIDELSWTLKNYTRMPLRIRLICYSFVQGKSLAETNDLLHCHGCESLYCRNPHDLSISFALNNGYDYNYWKQLDFKATEIINKHLLQYNDILYPAGAIINLQNIMKYLESCQDQGEDGAWHSRQITMQIHNSILEIRNEESFFELVKESAVNMQPMRARARRIFVDFLSQYLNKMPEDDDIFEGDDRKVSFQRLHRCMDTFYFSTMNWSLADYKSDDDTNISVEEENNLIDDYESREKYFIDNLRYVVKGQRDVTRALFVAFLVFVARSTQRTNLSYDRLNSLLEQAGFSTMTPPNEGDNSIMFFDELMVEFLEKTHYNTPTEELCEITYRILEEQFLEKESETFFLTMLRSPKDTVNNQLEKNLK